ncbi:MAG: hypothetical protein ACI4SH_04220, partial [Candidatus Scatosoma sp.]
NMDDALCYGTLLSLSPSTGPACAWNGTEENKYVPQGVPEEIWRAFVDYVDTDGYYFLQEVWRVDGTKTLNWTYYPPQNFKILLFYPENGAFVCGEKCERYAFHSYFSVDVSPSVLVATASGAPIFVEKNYNYAGEFFSLLFRVLVTVSAETAIALLFGFKKKRSFLILAGVNLCTQLLLNGFLNAVAYASGTAEIFFPYLLAELSVFAAEATAYVFLFGKKRAGGRTTEKAGESAGEVAGEITDVAAKKEKNAARDIFSAKKLVVYAAVANAISFFIGLPLALFFPLLF